MLPKNGNWEVRSWERKVNISLKQYELAVIYNVFQFISVYTIGSVRL